ncbi:MAG: RHS repeat-associated core domain-containing protein [Verrucomicrobiota bacterium]
MDNSSLTLDKPVLVPIPECPSLSADPILSLGLDPQPPQPIVPILGQEGVLEVEYIRGSDYGGGVGGILYTLRGGAPSYKHYNSRGDVVAATDSSGSLTYQAAYEAFGTHGNSAGSREWDDGSVENDRQRANTKDEDPTGLLNEGFRYRDLQTGTFITRDPLGHVDGPNVYTYVTQNPWTFFDPLGLYDDETLEDLAKGVIGKIQEIIEPPERDSNEREGENSVAKFVNESQRIQKLTSELSTQINDYLEQKQIRELIDSQINSSGLSDFQKHLATRMVARSPESWYLKY